MKVKGNCGAEVGRTGGDGGSRAGQGGPTKLTMYEEAMRKHILRQFAKPSVVDKAAARATG